MRPGPKSENPEAVRRLASEGLCAREIAEKLAISRQRVYQIAETYGIVLRRALLRSATLG